MKIVLIRHAEADHLLENWSKKVSYNQFVEMLHRWEEVNLTDSGRQHALQIAKSLEGHFDLIYSSPLPRTKDTADLLNCSKREIVYDKSLEEIMIYPPKCLKKYTYSINFWIFTCILNSVFNGNLFVIMKQAKELYNNFLTSGSNHLLVVSHSARIHSLVLYAYLNSYLKVVKKDFKPCGISEIEFCLDFDLNKRKNKIINVND